jgi:prepilin-type N-terminal cleavage/methylation domain-containing protein
MRILKPRLCNHDKAKQGFSLVESLVAMGIIGITFLSLYAGITACLFNARMSREDMRASQILVEKMEAIRTYSWNQVISNGFIPTKFTIPFYTSATNGANSLQYTGTVTIAEVPFSTNYTNQMKSITVRLDWKTRETLRTREFTSYLAHYGMQRYVFNED